MDIQEKNRLPEGFLPRDPQPQGLKHHQEEKDQRGNGRVDM